MESKQQSHQQEGDERGFQILDQPSKQRREDSQQAETCVIGNLKSPLYITDIVACVRGLVQRLVREELEGKLFPRPTINQTGTSGVKFLRLDFKNELPDTIFTLSKIKAKNDKPVEIALHDIRSNSIVTEGPLSSIKIEICVLDDEFDSRGSEDWTAEEFKARILRPRDNKGKLLKGDTVITLENGVGYVTKKIVFTDNSSWTRNGMFRLGVKMVQSTSIGADIREGISVPFKVKENRGDLNQKRYPPSFNDQIWRLKKISKDGKIHKRLSKHGINTVKDLLQLHETNPSLLQEKFGKTSPKLQEAIIEHAETCVPKLTFDGQNYRSHNTVNSDEKKDEVPSFHSQRLERVKEQHAYRNINDLNPVDKTSAHSLPSPLASPQFAGQCGAPNLQALDLPAAQKGMHYAGLQVAQHGATDQGLQQFEFPISQKGQPETWPNLCEPFTSSHIDEAAHSDQLRSNLLPQLGEMPLNWSAWGQFTTGSYNEANGWLVSGSHNDQLATYFSPAIPWEHVNLFDPPYGDLAEYSNYSSLPNSAV